MEDTGVRHSEEEEQKSLVPFLEEEEKEDEAGWFSDVEEHWEDLLEYKLEEELAGGGRKGNKDASGGIQGKSDSSMERLEHCLDNINNIQAMKHNDRIYLSVLQKNLKELNDIAKEKELVVQKVRDKLSTCRLRIETLAKQLEYVGVEIEKEEAAGNTAASSLLQATRRRVCAELEKEKDSELKIALTLNQDMLEMWKIETEQGKYETLHEQLKKDEEELETQYQERAKVRIQKEKIAALQAEGNQQSREKKEEEAQKEYEERQKKMLEDAKKNHEKAVCFLRKSMARIHEENAKEEERTWEHMERRIQAVLSLKTSIASNREKLRTLQAWKRAKALAAREREVRMGEAVLAGGGNVAKEILLHKQSLEHEKQKQASRELQKSRKMEIVSRILQEKASIHKQKKSQSRTKAIKSAHKLGDSAVWRRRTWRYIEQTCSHSAGATPQSWRSPSVYSSAGERSPPVGEISETVPRDALWESGEDEKEKDKTLAEPEFPGLWSQEHDLHKISKEEMDLKKLSTRTEKKENIHKQIMCGHEYKGCTFYSKPSCIHFKDFDVGQIYKKKIVLINAAYSVNSCRLVGISEWLKDFISINFDPPGKVCAGMSCEVLVTFKPMINETLEGEVMFMAQTGSFSVPLKCTAKRCISFPENDYFLSFPDYIEIYTKLSYWNNVELLALDKELIDFGSHVVGETISRTIALTNSGALGTRFRVQPSAGDSSTGGATAKSSPETLVTQRFSACVPEKKVSTRPVAAGLEEEQVCPEHSEAATGCTGRGEPGGPETGPSGTDTDQLDQNVLNSISDLDTETAHNLVELSPEETPVEIMLGKVTEGEIGPFSSVKLQVVFVPAIPGEARAEFVITFDNTDCKPLCFSTTGVSVDVPVWVPNPSVDLKICMYDRLYQDCVVVRSRAKVALCLKFEVCKELSKHMELLPKTGYVQAQSSFSVQLKFLPRHSLPEDAGSYFNEETRVLEAPVTILVVDKAKKVNLTVHAIVTTSDLEISPAQINFGYCTIYEAVQANVVLTNKSILPQEFGFVGLPEFVEIQPNDGFGILLPLESLTLDVIFKANKAKEYSFELTCKSEINRQFKLSCKAVGVHPPLELSHSLVRFAATALNAVSTATLYVLNSHVSVSPFARAVPRIGSGDVAPVGPASFEFHVPEDCPVTVAPCVGTVWPGEKSLIQVSFRPTLSDQLIREEAVRRLCRAAATEAEIQKSKKDEKRERKKSNHSASRLQSSRQLIRDGDGSEQPTSQELKPDSDAYMAAQAFLMRNFSGRFDKFIIPCFVASGHTDEKEGSETLSCSPYNTLYLELHCPAVAPCVVVTSDNGKNTVNFGDVTVGHSMRKQVTIQNISPEKLQVSLFGTFVLFQLGFSVLNPSGPFLLVRPVRMLEPGENKTLIISFCPNDDKWSCEMLDIQTAKTNLTLSITGRGVMPSTVCSVEDVLDMGYVMAREKVTSTFKIQNTSTLTLRYSIQLDSLSPTRDKDQQRIPSFIMSSLQRTEFVGTQNYNGLSVFSIFPTEGEIVAGKSQDFTVTFSPDHESLYYSDRLRVVLFGKQTAHVFRLKGAARDRPMFVEGGIPLDVPVESLAVTLPVLSQDTIKEELQGPVKSILLVLEYLDGEGSAEPATTELKVGAIQTAQFASKKNVEFSFDNLPLLQQKGFAIDSVKGTVECGQVKRIGVSWVPPADFCADDPLLVTALLTVKGDVNESYQILFMAKVVSAYTPTE